MPCGLKKGACISKDLPVNMAIEADRVRVVDEQGKQLGIMPLAEAVARAEEKGLDLVQVAANANPPVCKIMDYGKYKYEQSKKASQARKRQHVMQIKEVKVGANTDRHDLEVKLRRIRKFLEDGHKVKVSLRFRGREMAHVDRGAAQLKLVASEVEDCGKVEKMPNLEGRQMIMVIAPLKR